MTIMLLLFFENFTESKAATFLGPTQDNSGTREHI